jgi:hypothetical protein
MRFYSRFLDSAPAICLSTFIYYIILLLAVFILSGFLSFDFALLQPWSVNNNLFGRGNVMANAIPTSHLNNSLPSAPRRSSVTCDISPVRVTLLTKFIERHLSSVLRHRSP